MESTLKKLTDKQIESLKAPLPKDAVKPHPTKTYLSSIKAIYVVERFNDVFGLGGWQIQNEVVEAGEKNIVVKSTFHAPEYGIAVTDIFGGNDNADRGDAYKGACTDALTKIGSYLYVGMDVYKGLNDVPKAEKKNNAPADELEWLNPNDEKFEKAKEWLKSGGGTMQEIRKKYRVSKETEALLKDGTK